MKSEVVSIKVIPRAAKSEVAGSMSDGSLKVRVNAAPEKGKANDELRKVLAKHYGVPARDIEIIAGAASTRKQVRISWPA